MPSRDPYVPKTGEDATEYLRRLTGVPFVSENFETIHEKELGRITSLANYIRSAFKRVDQPLTPWSGWVWQSGTDYVVSTPDVCPFPPFDPWKQTAPVVGILGECAYCWEAIVPVPSVLTLIYTP